MTEGILEEDYPSIEFAEEVRERRRVGEATLQHAQEGNYVPLRERLLAIAGTLERGWFQRKISKPGRDLQIREKLLELAKAIPHNGRPFIPPPPMIR